MWNWRKPRDNTRALARLAEPCRAEPSRAVRCGACQVRARFYLSIRKSKRTDIDGDRWSLVSLFLAIKKNSVLVLDGDCSPLDFWQLLTFGYWQLLAFGFWRLSTVGLWFSGKCWLLVFWQLLAFGLRVLAIKGTAFCFFWLLPQFSSTIFVVVSGDLHPGEARVRPYWESRPPEPSSSKACTSEDA